MVKSSSLGYGMYCVCNVKMNETIQVKTLYSLHSATQIDRREYTCIDISICFVDLYNMCYFQVRVQRWRRLVHTVAS